MCLPVPYAYPDVVFHFNPHPSILLRVHYPKAYLGYHCCTKTLIVGSTSYCTWSDGPITQVDLMGDLDPGKTQNSTLSDLAHFCSVDSSGPDEWNDAKSRVICLSC